MSFLNTDVYSHSEHIFRFAAWSASTAARSSPKCRFSVKIGNKILLDSDLYKYSYGFNYLPEPNEFDIEHKKLCNKIIQTSKKYLPKKKSEKFSYGIAAKLLNCYFKSIYLIQFQSSLDKTTQSKVDAIHPPIDRILLTELSKKDIIKERVKFWREKANYGWSKFKEQDYDEVIKEIKEIQKEKNEPLWMIENAWLGYQ